MTSATFHSPPSAQPEAEILNELARVLAAELDLQSLLQKVTDAGTQLTGARFGAFFYNSVNDQGGAFLLYTLSGAPREAFERLGMPRATAIFGPTFRGEGVVRIADVLQDPRYGRNAPHRGMPAGHLPVRSYLAVPVISRGGEVFGGLFFGHPDPGVFTERAERLALGIAAHAAIAVDNARLYGRARQELADRAAAEAALRESEARYRLLLRSLPAAVYTCDAEGRVTMYNEAAAALWGRAPEIGKDLWCGSWRIYWPDGTPMPLDACPMAVAIREGRAVLDREIVVERPDGTRRLVEPHPEPILDENGRVRGAINMLVDITERRRASQAQAMLAAIVESSDDAIISKNLDGIIQSWNAGAERIFGYTAEEIVGRPVTTLMPPDRVNEEPAILERLRRGERIDHYETVRQRKDGTPIDISLTVSPIRDAHGRVVGASKIARDITERKRTEAELNRYREHLEEEVQARTEELRISHEQLRMSERMAALGTLSAGVGHDMGNLLLPVRVCLETLQAAGLPAPLLGEVARIKTCTDYLQQLATGLRLMALDPRRSRPTEPTELHRWWTEVGLIMANALPRGIELEADLSGVCWAGISKPALTQAVFNLVQNAGEAMRTRGHGRVRVASRCEGDRVLVTVEDDGPGMTPEVREHCMEPFFTTKTRGISTGLGLVLVNGLVRDAGGTVDLVTAPGRGTRFTLTIPAAPGGAQHTARSTGARGRAVVTLADKRLVSFVTAELGALGFEVVGPANAAAAEVDIAVVDDRAGQGPSCVRARRTVLFADANGTPPPAGAVAIGRRPSLEAIRSELWAAAGAVHQSGGTPS